jgi:hypothetical protein
MQILGFVSVQVVPYDEAWSERFLRRSGALFTWEALAAADEWAQRSGWLPGPSDA